MRTKPEILAPAGSPESLMAALRCGADAVYLGAKAFSARAGAENFDEQGLKDAVAQCHIRGASVYLALNTVLFDNELPQAAKLIEQAAEAGVDAIIVQDLGVAKLIKETCPAMPLHASTQMSIHTPMGARLLYEHGFKRVVLARELSLSEIKEIVDSCPIETEVFVHGALCMSVSGQCYMSSMAGRRSGNRGQCAQPCRLPFDRKNGGGDCGLSLKDLSLVDKLSELAAAGVTSFKIEGRLKRPEYVAAAVTACIAGRDGTAEKEMLSTLKAVFSRSGFTEGYYTGKLGEEMFGTRQKDDVVSAAGVLPTLQKLYEKETQRVPVKFKYTQAEGKSISLECTDELKNLVAAYGELPEKAQNKPTTADRAIASIQKLGGTPFYAEDIACDIDETLMVSVSNINALRRECIEKLTILRSDPDKRFAAQPNLNHPKLMNIKIPLLRARFRSFEQLPLDHAAELEYIYLPLGEILIHAEELYPLRDKIVIELPCAMFGVEEQLKEQIEQLKRMGIMHICAMNIATIELGEELGLAVHGGFGLNTVNSMALKALSGLNVCDTELSVEIELNAAKRLGDYIPYGIVAYGRLPLMLVRNCPLKHSTDCAKCGKKGGYMFDRLGNRFIVACSGPGSEIFNCQTLYLADRLSEMEGLSFLTLMFTFEDKDEAARIINQYQRGGEKPDELTRGLYYRGIL